MGNKDGERTRGHDLGSGITKFLSLERRRLRGDPIAAQNLLMMGSREGGGREGGVVLFFLVSSNSKWLKVVSGEVQVGH